MTCWPRLIHHGKPSMTIPDGESVMAPTIRTIGSSEYAYTRPFTMEVVNLAVHADFQRQGIGKSLIEYAKHKSRSERCSVLEVGTANAGTGQLAFYQKCGFEIDGIDRDFFRRNYPDPIFENGIECRHMVRLRIEL